MILFSWKSALKEIKRLRLAGVKAKLEKRWYGWVIIDD